MDGHCLLFVVPIEKDRTTLLLAKSRLSFFVFVFIPNSILPSDTIVRPPTAQINNGTLEENHFLAACAAKKDTWNIECTPDKKGARRMKRDRAG